MIFQIPSGLSIYQSWFLNPDGSRGVIGGPHKVFIEIEAKHYNTKSFISNQYALFRCGYQVDLDISLLQIQESKNYLILDEEINGASTVSVKGEQSEKNCFVIRSQKQFQMVESAGSEISYRCSSCRVQRLQKS